MIVVAAIFCRNIKVYMRTWQFLIVAFIAFSQDVANAQPPVESAPLKVGAILPLTGPVSEYGIAFQNGIDLARRDSEEISKNCSFIVEDSKYDSKTAVSAFQKLSTVDKAPVIYNWGGPPSEAIAPLADRNNIAVFVWSADPRVSEGRSQVIRFSNSGADYGETLAKYLRARGYHNLGIVKTENQYIQAILDGFEAAAETLKIEVIDTYQPGDQDFRATVTKIKKKKFDAIGIFLLSGQVAQFANQLRSQAVQIPVFGTDFFESMTEVKQSHGALIGAVFANNEVVPAFRGAYIQRFKNDLQINHAANGYDFANFLCRELGAKVKSLSPLEIIKLAGNTSQFEGQQGPAVFTTSARGDKYFRFPVVMRRIESSRIVTEDAD